MLAEAFQAAARAGPGRAPLPRLIIAGATGVLGSEVLRRLAGLHRYERTEVLAREPMTEGVRGVHSCVVAGGDPAQWPGVPAEVGLVMFDPPRLFNDRERALWTPRPEDLPALARWLRASGVETLVVVLPHAQGRLPDALKRGLASLDELAVAALGFERLVIVRTARKPGPAAAPGLLHGIAHWMLAILKYMVPQGEQPVRAVKVAEFVAAVLEHAPPGVHVAAPELVWRAAQGDPAAQVRRWLAR